jgi:hypothetical protein
MEMQPSLKFLASDVDGNFRLASVFSTGGREP